MNHNSGEKGFFKAIIVVVAGFCVLFIFFFKFAQYFSAGLSTGSSSERPRVSSGYSYTSASNPLLDFGELSDNINSYSGDGSRIIPNKDGVRTSSYAGKVRLSTGNARSTAQPYEEYVEIRNRGDEPVNITGWRLENGKGSRPVENRTNDYFYPTADSAVIGQGTEFLSPSGRFEVGSIILAADDTAIVTTGGPFSQYSFSIYTSFRENICVGYLEHFPFTPRVQKSCPALANDPLIRTVTDECYDYIRRITRCDDPSKGDTKREREEYDLLSNQCRQFIEGRANYTGCVANNMGRPDFSTDQWRVFLGKNKEMWARDRETITLYDNAGLIVDQVVY